MIDDTTDLRLWDMTRLAFAYCPACLARIDLDRKPALGHVVTCGCCTEVLRITDLDPLQIDWAAEMTSEGWEGDWEVELERV